MKLRKNEKMKKSPKKKQKNKEIEGKFVTRNELYRTANIMPGISYHIDYSKIVVGKLLGCGQYGKVYAGTYFGSNVAIKQLKTDDAESFTKEVKCLLKVSHPACVKIYGYFTYPHLGILMDIYPSDLHDIIHNQKSTLNMQMKLNFSKDIISGLLYLHSLHIIHRDLKPKNVLITVDNHAKITDFGTATPSDVYISDSLVGTLLYLAPELFKSNGYEYSQTTDLYALSITLWEILEQKLPFYHLISNIPQSQVFDRLSEAMSTNKRPLITNSTNSYPILEKIIISYWDNEPKTRLNISLENSLSLLGQCF